MWRCAGVMMLVVACGKGGAKPARPSDGPLEVSVECLDRAALVARLRVLWSVPTGHDVDATCTPGRFPRPGWAVAAVIDVSEDEAYERSVVLAADGSVIAQTEANAIAPWFRAEGGGGTLYEVVDFDGDQIGELVSRGGASHGGSTTETLEIYRIVGGGLASALVVITHEDNGGAAEEEVDVVECEAKVTFVPDGKALTVVADGTVTEQRPHPASEDESCFVGRRVYRLVGDRFVRE